MIDGMKVSLLNKLRSHAHSHRGFSLVEMLIYISILVLVSGGALTVLFDLTDHLNRSRSERLMVNTAQTVLERMLTEIRISGAVDEPNSTLGSSPGALSLLQPGTTTVNFEMNGGVLRVERDDVDLGALTDSVVVDSLVFHHYENPLTEMVGIELTLSAVVGGATTTRTFNTAAVLRGSYD